MILRYTIFPEVLHARPCNRVIADEDVWRANHPDEEGKAPNI